MRSLLETAAERAIAYLEGLEAAVSYTHLFVLPSTKFLLPLSLSREKHLQPITQLAPIELVVLHLESL